MTLSIRPDPAHPKGGYAVLDLPAERLTGDTALVAVYNSYSERFLGESGWFASRTDFGPYPVRRAEGRAGVVIGPEIVNQIEDNAALVLFVGPVRAETVWPDDVVPLPGAGSSLTGLTLGPGLGDAKPRADHPAASLSGPQPGGGRAGADRAGPGGDPVPADLPAPAGRKPLVIAGLGAALAALAAAVWFMAGARPEQTAVPAVVAAVPVEARGDLCTDERLRGLGNRGFAEIARELVACGSAANPETALGLLEDAADRTDPDALLMFGELYDAGAAESVLKSAVGLDLGDIPANAADYYGRARAAGNPAAAIRLSSLCKRLSGATDTLSTAAHGEYCSQ